MRDNSQRYFLSIRWLFSRSLIQNAWKFPDELQKWTSFDVTAFLSDPRFNVLLPCFFGSTGKELYNFYMRHSADHNEMLRILLSRLPKESRLTEATLEMFLERLEHYTSNASAPEPSSTKIAPTANPSVSTGVKSSKVCIVM